MCSVLSSASVVVVLVAVVIAPWSLFCVCDGFGMMDGWTDGFILLLLKNKKVSTKIKHQTKRQNAIFYVSM
jgi:hypothetical protein